MKHPARTIVLALMLCVSNSPKAQVPVSENPNQRQMLITGDAHSVANKQLVYNFWREVFESGHMELAEKYLATSYIQHNPNVPTGREAFIGFFSKFVRPKDIEPKITAPLVAIVAQGDLVVLAFARSNAEPDDPTKTYTTTWFDMFRIEDGKIVEHWDPATKR